MRLSLKVAEAACELEPTILSQGFITRIHMCIYAYKHVCIHKMRMCMYVCMYVCMYIYTHIYIYIPAPSFDTLILARSGFRALFGKSCVY